MRIHWIQPAARMASLVLLLAAVSCSKQSTESTSTDTGTPAQTADQQLAVSHIEIGRNVDADKRVTEQTLTFTPNETVYATIVTNGAASNAEIKTRWTFEDGQVVDESTQSISPTGNAATEFHVSKPDGLPAGKYKVEVFVNGAPAGVQEFEVKAS